MSSGPASSPAASGGGLLVRGLRKEFALPGRSPRRVLALDGVSFSVRPGEFFAVTGPSGCGKTTLLNLLGGLVPCEQGDLLADGKPITGPGSDRVVVFQDSGLFDWKTVLDNVAFGLRARGQSWAAARAAAEPYLDLVQLAGYRDRYPCHLSGGMKQRVALARALAADPQCVLLDEPLGHLDYQWRVLLQDELLRVWAQTRKTMVLVTHDVEEAVYLADRVLVLTASPGRVKEICEVDLPRPRTEQLRMAPRFQALKQRVWDAVERPLAA